MYVYTACRRFAVSSLILNGTATHTLSLCLAVCDADFLVSKRNDAAIDPDHRFLVSLDGVIQPDDGPSAGTTNSAVGGVEESAAAGGTSGGAGAGGKKRKLFKAFKPPARRAPPPAPPSDDSWPPPRPGMMGQLRNGEPNGDGGGMMSPRTSYNGFGHVESLWDDEDDDQEYNGEGVYRRDDRGGLASGPGGSAAASGAGWGMDAGAGDPNAREVGGGEGTCPGRMKSSSMPSAAAAVSPIASEWTSRQEDGWHAGGRNASSGLLRSAGDIARHFPAQPDKDPADRGQGQDDPSPYLESLRSGGRGAEEWPGPTYSSSAQRGGGHDVDGAGDQGHYYSEHPRHDDDGRVPREGRPIERNAAAQYGGEVRDVPEADLEQPAGRGDSGGRAAGAVSQHGRETLDAPEADREQPAGRGDSSGRVSAGAVEMRSTQDILSLFGGLEEDGGEHGYAGPRGPETAPATLQHSRGPNDATARPETTGGVLLPVGGGTPRAADMRRAQKESRAAATAAAGGAAATAAAAGAALAGSVNPGTGPAAASGVAADAAPPLGDWACGVCGVRGGASATSCRVCGAPRQGPIDEGFPGQGGGVDRHGVVDGFSGSEHRRGWDAADFRRGEDWQEQEWDGVAKNGNAGGGAGGHDELGGDGRAEGILLHGGEDVLGGSGHPGSYPVCSPPSRMEREGGAEGGVARGFGSVPRASGEQHRARMQIDVGSSSDSDDA